MKAFEDLIAGEERILSFYRKSSHDFREKHLSAFLDFMKDQKETNVRILKEINDIEEKNYEIRKSTLEFFRKRAEFSGNVTDDDFCMLLHKAIGLELRIFEGYCEADMLLENRNAKRLMGMLIGRQKKHILIMRDFGTKSLKGFVSLG